MLLMCVCALVSQKAGKITDNKLSKYNQTANGQRVQIQIPSDSFICHFYAHIKTKLRFTHPPLSDSMPDKRLQHSGLKNH